MYLKETVILAGKAYLFDYVRAPRILKALEIDERNGVIGGLDLVEIRTIVCRSDIVRGNMGCTRHKVG